MEADRKNPRRRLAALRDWALIALLARLPLKANRVVALTVAEAGELCATDRLESSVYELEPLASWLEARGGKPSSPAFCGVRQSTGLLRESGLSTRGLHKILTARIGASGNPRALRELAKLRVANERMRRLESLDRFLGRVDATYPLNSKRR